MEKHISAPISDEDAQALRAGDYVYITGTIYTARDAAHLRMDEALNNHEPLPIDLTNNIIYTPRLLDLGLKGMIGKGKRSDAVREAIVRNHAVYFAAVGGAGALLSKSIKTSQVIAYDDLGTEAIRKLEVENFPVIVVIDSEGSNLYETAICSYRED